MSQQIEQIDTEAKHEVPPEIASISAKKSRHWFLTKNNPAESLEEFCDFAKQGATYIRAQVEKGSSGTVHFQACLGYKNQLHFLSMQKKFTGCHVMVTRNPGAAYDYCGKEDSRIYGPIQYGCPPPRLNVTGEKKAFNQRALEIGAERCVEEGHIKITDYIKLKSNIDLYLNCTTRPEAVPSLQNEWIYGAPGVGKTKSVIDRFPGFYDKDKSKFWNGYTNQEVVLIDDIEADETFMLGLLKKICQHKAFPAEDKFGQMRQIRPSKVIVTSNFHFTEIWTKTVDQEALARRFQVHHIIAKL